MCITFEPSNIKVITSSDSGIFIIMNLTLKNDCNIYFSDGNGLMPATEPWVMRIFCKNSDNENAGAMYYLGNPSAAQLEVSYSSKEFNSLLSMLITGNKPDLVSINTDGMEYSHGGKVWNVKEQVKITGFNVHTPIKFL